MKIIAVAALEDGKVELVCLTCAVSSPLQEKLMGHLGVVLYEYLGEEYPEVLGSILGALKAIVNVIGTSLRLILQPAM